MTLERQAANAGFVLDAAPVGGIDAVKAWAAGALQSVQDQLQRPHPVSITFGRLDAIPDPEVGKPVDGMLVYLGAGVAGAGKPQGLYLRDAGAWKQVQAI